MVSVGKSLVAGGCTLASLAQSVRIDQYMMGSFPTTGAASYSGHHYLPLVAGLLPSTVRGPLNWWDRSPPRGWQAMVGKPSTCPQSPLGGIARHREAIMAGGWWVACQPMSIPRLRFSLHWWGVLEHAMGQEVPFPGHNSFSMVFEVSPCEPHT